MKFRTFVTACLSVFMFVRVTADRSLLLGITRPAMEVMELAENKEKVHFQLLGENYSEPSMRYF